jgi:hypothetical protein
VPALADVAPPPLLLLLLHAAAIMTNATAPTRAFVVPLIRPTSL